MSRNVRLNKGSGAFRTGRELAKETPVSQKKPSGQALDREAAALRNRIERLEHVVHMAGTVAAGSGAVGSRRRPHARREKERRQALLLAFQFLLMALLIAAALGWLNQRFHFFG
jgi:hypothetical protein